MNPAVKVLVISGVVEGHADADWGSGPNIPLLHKPFSSEKLALAVHQLLAATAQTNK